MDTRYYPLDRTASLSLILQGHAGLLGSTLSCISSLLTPESVVTRVWLRVWLRHTSHLGVSPHLLISTPYNEEPYLLRDYRPTCAIYIFCFGFRAGGIFGVTGRNTVGRLKAGKSFTSAYDLAEVDKTCGRSYGDLYPYTPPSLVD